VLDELIKQGLHHHQAGRLADAKLLYNQVLAINPRHPDALHLLGLAALQGGDPASAAELIRKAAALQPKNWAFQANLAMALTGLGALDEALSAFKRAARLNPDEPQFQMGIANCLALRGKHAVAEAQLRRITQRFPGYALAWFNLGNAVRDQGRIEAAADFYRRAIATDSGLLDAHNNLGNALQTLGRLEDAEQTYRRALALKPDYALGLCNLASVLIDLGRFEEAEPICREMINRNPALADAHLFLGSTLGHRGRLHESLVSYRRAAELDPANARALATVGSALHEIGRPDEALLWLNRALTIAPQAVEIQQLLSTLLLAEGVLQEGWRHYGQRAVRLRFLQKYPAVPIQTQLERELQGKRVVVLREQGLGDEIFFLRFAPLLANRGARVLYRSSRKIAGMLARVAAIAEVMDENAPIPTGDAVLLVGDLPHALGALPLADLPPTPHRIAPEAARIPTLFRRAIRVYWPPAPPPLRLSPHPDRLDEVRRQLANIGPPPYIGVTWRGGVSLQEQRGSFWTLFKEIDLARFGAALAPATGTILALQRNPQPGEIDALAKFIGRPVRDFTALNEDLEAMLALLVLIDDYVGVSNTNMHLRAGVGKAARVVVPCPAEWRWMVSGKSSPWFPGFKIYRQTSRGDWGPALAELASDLAAVH
jgi:tetratricopeptide (TPR) repeat protein